VWITELVEIINEACHSDFSEQVFQVCSVHATPNSFEMRDFVRSNAAR